MDVVVGRDMRDPENNEIIKPAPTRLASAGV
jgi:hypothetical protein